MLESINQEFQVEDSTTATEARESFDATRTAIGISNETIRTQISASATAAVEATATAEAGGQ